MCYQQHRARIRFAALRRLEQRLQVLPVEVWVEKQGAVEIQPRGDDQRRLLGPPRRTGEQRIDPHGDAAQAIGCIERLGAPMIGQAAVKIRKPRTLGLRFAVP